MSLKSNRSILVLIAVLVIAAILLLSFNKDFFSNPEIESNPIAISNGKEIDSICRIPAGVNAWVVNDIESSDKILSKEGIANWKDLGKIIRIYFSVDEASLLKVGLRLKTESGNSRIKVKLGDASKEITVSNTAFNDEFIGDFPVESGYHFLELQGLEKDAENIVEISELLLRGINPNSINYIPVKNNYFGRRGPSVHVSYTAPSEKDVLYFYNEVTVPEGEDVEGSFFMANGHAQGYFGMQVNSETERRILFSIWSGFKTDNPDEIPSDYQVTNLGNGKGVTVQNFGNEGSGKQSIKVFNWRAGTTYKFLLKGEPAVNNSTDYSAYFYATEVGQWQFIASLRRPKISTHLKGLHSFLENFIPRTGVISRKVEFGNQWVYTTDDGWHEMTNGKFTADATARNGDRLDFSGGTSGNRFFLKNCGFFNNDIQPGALLKREASGTPPDIDFLALEKLKE